MNIILQRDYIAPVDRQITTIEQYQQRRVMRRRRVAKRLAKRFPMFAVEIMQAEFPGYSYDEFVADISRRTRKGKSIRHPKSPLKRQGRYPLYEKAMTQYELTKDVKFLEEAQKWRNRLYLPFEVWFKLNGETKVITLHSETPLRTVEQLSQIKFATWDEWQAQYDKIMEWAHTS